MKKEISARDREIDEAFGVGMLNRGSAALLSTGVVVLGLCANFIPFMTAQIIGAVLACSGMVGMVAAIKSEKAAAWILDHNPFPFLKRLHGHAAHPEFKNLAIHDITEKILQRGQHAPAAAENAAEKDAFGKLLHELFTSIRLDGIGNTAGEVISALEGKKSKAPRKYISLNGEEIVDVIKQVENNFLDAGRELQPKAYMRLLEDGGFCRKALESTVLQGFLLSRGVILVGTEFAAAPVPSGNIRIPPEIAARLERASPSAVEKILTRGPGARQGGNRGNETDRLN